MSSQKFWKFHRKTPVLESLFNKVAGLTALLKSCEIFTFFKNAYFEEHQLMAASEDGINMSRNNM